jgi:hypothetical protein
LCLTLSHFQNHTSPPPFPLHLFSLFFSLSFVFLFPITAFLCTCDDLRSPKNTNKTSTLFACKFPSFPLHTFVATKIEMYFFSCFIENTSHLEHCLPSSTF